jgi:dihydrofolate reductase
MGKLIFGSNQSLDGWTETSTGALDWAPPDEEVFAFVTERMRSAGTYLYGRRMYETLAVWETDPALGAGSELEGAYAETWKAAEKVVYSTTLEATWTERTRLEARFDPDAVRELKATTDHDLLIGGPNLAAQAFDGGLVDECWLLVWPIVLGSGRAAALQGTSPLELELLDERRFANGVVHLHHRVR